MLKAKSGDGFLGMGSESPPQQTREPQPHRRILGACIQRPENVFAGCKCHLVPAQQQLYH